MTLPEPTLLPRAPPRGICPLVSASTTKYSRIYSGPGFFWISTKTGELQAMTLSFVWLGDGAQRWEQAGCSHRDEDAFSDGRVCNDVDREGPGWASVSWRLSLASWRGQRPDGAGGASLLNSGGLVVTPGATGVDRHGCAAEIRQKLKMFCSSWYMHSPSEKVTTQHSIIS